MDPAALGTLIIGLQAADAHLEPDLPRSRNQRQRARPRGQFRVPLAKALRTLADRLEPA